MTFYHLAHGCSYLTVGALFGDSESLFSSTSLLEDFLRATFSKEAAKQLSSSLNTIAYCPNSSSVHYLARLSSSLPFLAILDFLLEVLPLDILKVS